MVEGQIERPVPPFKGKGTKRSFRYVRTALDEYFAFRDSLDAYFVSEAGLDQRMSGLNGAKMRLQKIALRMADDFWESYPDARITLRRNSRASNTFLRWRFTTEKLGKGDVQFSDYRIASALSRFGDEVVLDWLAFETYRLQLNHAIALIIHEQKRLALFGRSMETVRGHRRSLRLRSENER